jgi:hypothetical protein
MKRDEGMEGFRFQVSGVRVKRYGPESEAHRTESKGLRIKGRFFGCCGNRKQERKKWQKKKKNTLNYPELKKAF